MKLLITLSSSALEILVQPSISNLVSTEGDDGNGGDSAVEVCIELASENLQRNVTVNVRTISSPTATGKYVCIAFFNGLTCALLLLSKFLGFWVYMTHVNECW